MVKETAICEPRYPNLRDGIPAFYHTHYLNFGSPGNPDYLYLLKNNKLERSERVLANAKEIVVEILRHDLPVVQQRLDLSPLMVCVVPRAKKREYYDVRQLQFLHAVKQVVQELPGIEDGTEMIVRHTDTKTTHLRRPDPEIKNLGPEPYRGIIKDTCHIGDVDGKDILLIDDIYTRSVGIDEDAIQTLFDCSARTVAMYVIGWTVKKWK